MLVEAGLRPIIAHAERNIYIQRHPAYALRLVALGCYLQVTASSLFGSFGPASQEAAGRLLSKRLTHVIASDAHGIGQRRPILSKAYDHISQRFDEPTARLLFHDNPYAAIYGGPISEMPKPRRPRFGLSFLRTVNASEIDRKTHKSRIQC
jgi:protein-tyrosine phosphatase